MCMDLKKTHEFPVHNMVYSIVGVVKRCYYKSYNDGNMNHRQTPSAFDQLFDTNRK